MPCGWISWIMGGFQILSALDPPNDQSIDSITKSIAWDFPLPRWIKLNTDGSSGGNPSDVGCGGLFRNSNGHWISGFIYHIDNCTAQFAEIWAIYIGFGMLSLGKLW